MTALRRALRRRSDQQLALGILGLVVTFLLAQAVPPGWPRAAVAALGAAGFSFGAIGRCAQALAAAPRHERLPWILIGAAVTAWLVGKLIRSMFLVAEVALGSPSLADGADLVAAALFTVGFVAFLRGQRIAVYALILDALSVVFVMTAAIAFAVQDVFISEMVSDPLAAITVVLYTLLYAAATAAGISALFAVPADASQRSQRLLVIGVGAIAAAYALSLPQYLHGTFVSGTLVDPLWMAGMLAISVGASSSIEDRAVHVKPRASHATLQFARMVLPGAVAGLTAVLILLAEERRTEGIVDAAAALITIVLAARTGLALYANLRLSEIEGRRARQFEALYEVGLAAAGERSLEELLKLVVEQATSLSRTDGAMLALAEPDRRYVIRALHKGGLPQLRDSVGEPLAGLSRAALEKRDLVVADRYEDHPSSTVPLHGIIQSAIAIPLVAHGEVIGTLAAYSATPRRFSSDTRRLVRLYAAQAAIAIANAQLLAETHRLARDDDLTGVMNRRSLMERLESEIHGATRHGDILAVVLCDVDGLKAVNDSAGHLAGNEVLMKVARVMRETVRVEDVVARFGGDEFVILLPRTGLLPAQALVGRIAARLRDEGYHWAGREEPVPGVSFGIAWFPEDGRTADALIAAADERMYVEKARGRSRRESAAEGD
ncbi:MAG TPA: sensor domain-containing diguanylate cyclase [Candidatus Limnocylindria bacterium]|nr:sensor domain-containing diguanylate cyclase [Candidatus Limnocylindria bacterium]